MMAYGHLHAQQHQHYHVVLTEQTKTNRDSGVVVEPVSKSYHQMTKLYGLHILHV